MLKRNLTLSLNDLRLGLISPKKFKKHQHVTRDLIKKLSLDKELVGHNGCVNCLEWNETGELLASGSDDTHVIIWDPFNHEMRANINTLHKGNIFSVKFLPKFNNTKVATGAADFFVKVIDISNETVIDNYSCHMSRVKRLAVCYNEPYLLWSCSEDGTVRQFDIREPPCSQSNCQSPNVLINLSSNIGATSEVKCLAINPIKSELIAIGSNDPYVRLYDRRKLTLKSFQNTSEISINRRNRSSIKRNSNGTFHISDDSATIDMADDVVQYFIPGHIPYSSHLGNKYSHSQISTTYLTFSPDGTRLLVNMGSELVYLYDVNKVRPVINFQTSLAKYVANCDTDLYCDYSAFRTDSNVTIAPVPVLKPNGIVEDDNDSSDMPLYLNKLKEQGNKMYKKSDFHSAVTFYNTALNYSDKKYARFYANRAAAYISRNWTGDIYAALLDSIQALQIDYNHIKSHFRISQCLYQLNMIAEAHDYINYLEYLYPEQAKKIKQVGELKKKVADKISDVIDKLNKEVSNDKSSNGSVIPNEKSFIYNISNVTNLPEKINKNIRTRRYLESISFSKEELQYRSQSSDYNNRYCGHCNTTTDIKEANFFGIDGQYIMAGSDDGNIFFWDRQSENILRVLRGDTNIVNCLQPHPTVCMLATSGIDNVVRLWTPNFVPHQKNSSENEDGSINIGMTENNIGTEQNELKAAQSNQERLNVDPFEVVLMNMGLHSTIMPQYNTDDFEGSDGEPDGNSEDNSHDSSGAPRGRRSRRIHIENPEYCRSS